MSKLSKLEKDLKQAKDKGVSSWQIAIECRTTNPQKLVEKLRAKYGYNQITDIWEHKKVVIDGTILTERWKRYFWDFDYGK